MKILVILLISTTCLSLSEARQKVIKKSTQDTINPNENPSYKVKNDTVNFYLYTKSDPNNGVLLDRNNPRIDNYNNATVVFFIHGWTESRNTVWYKYLKSAFFGKEDVYDVIHVDYNTTSRQFYSIAAHNAKAVGDRIGDFIADLSQNSDIPLKKLLVVGISLGGQISGFVGKRIFDRTTVKLPRIIALDPASPLFVNRKVENRLNKNDADVVEVLHTNGGAFGFYYACGTIDFFANGGSMQPGCDNKEERLSSIAETILNLDDGPDKDIFGGIIGSIGREGCSHGRSALYFIEAVSNSNGFEAVQCNDYAKYHFGKCSQNDEGSVVVNLGDLATTMRGKFYFNTNKKSPFSMS